MFGSALFADKSPVWVTRGLHHPLPRWEGRCLDARLRGLPGLPSDLESRRQAHRFPCRRLAGLGHSGNERESQGPSRRVSTLCRPDLGLPGEPNVSQQVANRTRRRLARLSSAEERAVRLESLIELVDVADPVHRRPKQAVRVVDLEAAVVEEADVTGDELARPHMPGMPMPEEIEGVRAERRG
jgi:hypothetical protein